MISQRYQSHQLSMTIPTSLNRQQRLLYHHRNLFCHHSNQSYTLPHSGLHHNRQHRMRHQDLQHRQQFQHKTGVSQITDTPLRSHGTFLLRAVSCADPQDQQSWWTDSVMLRLNSRGEEIMHHDSQALPKHLCK